MITSCVENHRASSHFSWQKGDVLVSTGGCHCFPFPWCKVKSRCFSVREGFCFIHSSCSASPSEILLFHIADSVAMMRSTIGSCCREMSKLSPLAMTSFSGLMKSLAASRTIWTLRFWHLLFFLCWNSWVFSMKVLTSSCRGFTTICTLDLVTKHASKQRTGENDQINNTLVRWFRGTHVTLMAPQVWMAPLLLKGPAWLLRWLAQAVLMTSRCRVVLF